MGSPTRAGGSAHGGPTVSFLLERDEVLDTVASALHRAGAGAGAGVLVEGSAGTGKTSVARACAVAAEAEGFRVLQARGLDLERGFPWGVAVQLLQRLDPEERATVLRGAAALAQPLVDASALDTADGDPFPRVHGLHWAVANLSEVRPLLLVVDDAQWADPQTLRWLCYLLARVEDLPVVVLVTARTGEPTSTEVARLLAHLTTMSTTVTLWPLSADAVRTLVSRLLPEATDAFRTSVVDAVAGNPFLCHQLAATVRHEAIVPDDTAADHLHDLRPAGIRNAMLVQLGQLGSDAADVAAAVAALESAATPEVLVAVSGLTEDQLDGVLDQLYASTLLSPGDDAPSFVHPIVREAVLEDLGPARRARLHATAARVLHGLSRRDQDVASQLLRASPVREEWAVEVLRRTATDAMRRAAPARAVELLDTALELVVDPAVEVQVLVELGTAEAAAGMASALTHLGEALRRTSRAETTVPVAVTLGDSLYAAGRFEDAARAYDHGRRLRSDDVRLDPRVEARLLGGLDMSRNLHSRPSGEAARRLAGLRPADAADEHLQTLLRAITAGQMALGLAGSADGAPVTHARLVDLTDRAMTAPDLLREAGLPILEPLVLALVRCERWRRALAFVDELSEVASRRGHMTTHASLLPLRALCNLMLGRLTDAAGDGTDGIRLAEDTSAAFLATSAVSRYALAVASLERDRPDEALDAVSHPRADQHWGGSPLYGWFLTGQGAVDLARGRHEQALAAFTRAGERFMSAGGPGAFCDWRGGAALAARGMGDLDTARECAEDNLTLAEAFGAPATIAGALRVRALISDDRDEAVDLLGRARTLVAGTDAALERARVHVELGAALRRAGHRRDARAMLRAGLAEAQRCGAHRLVRRVGEELEVAGARRPELAVEGVDALTPSELRVARRAAAGHSNRAIAEQLFVTRKTVETHLSNVYRKLGIASRGQLRSAIADTDADPAAERP